ncbi:MAG TPA: bacteriohopanetetrol glucosamine biosynthesis glycosyltransferase HpnI [Bryobacteraceae bacterium]|nr:bacteriohopanetetrol glucosamine biosynthesis glycosyltransferase HpnI [Bryobacteraceae bacterium]
MNALWLVFLVPLFYQAIVIAVCLRQSLRKKRETRVPLPVSILKPVRGLDPEMQTALRSQALQDYPEFEILFGVGDADDPAIAVIEELRREFPDVAIALHIGAKPAQNAKVGILANLAQHATHPVWVVSDSDILVTPDYLTRITAPLEDAETGVVTCLYRAASHSAASWWEAVGIAIDFMPSTLVAPLVGVKEFGLGSTLCFRKSDLLAAGGFEALADYIADDYQLARRIVHLGKRAHLSEYVVETSLGDATWRGAWKHQLRWARTIRASKGAGFAGLFITHAGVWAIAAIALHWWAAATLLIGFRIAAALASGWLAIRIRRNPLSALLAPLWDLYAFAVWLWSYTSNDVEWRDRRLRIVADGKVEPR